MSAQRSELASDLRSMCEQSAHRHDEICHLLTGSMVIVLVRWHPLREVYTCQSTSGPSQPCA